LAASELERFNDLSRRAFVEERTPQKTERSAAPAAFRAPGAAVGQGQTADDASQAIPSGQRVPARGAQGVILPPGHVAPAPRASPREQDVQKKSERSKGHGWAVECNDYNNINKYLKSAY
jgi:hypothetical protein